MLFLEEGRDVRQTITTAMPHKRSFRVTYPAEQRGRRKEEARGGVPTKGHDFFSFLISCFPPSFICFIQQNFLLAGNSRSWDCRLTTPRTRVLIEM